MLKKTIPDQQEQNTHCNKNNNSITGAYWSWPKQFASWTNVSCHWRERKFALESTRNLVMAKPRIFGKSSAQWKLQSLLELMHARSSAVFLPTCTHTAIWLFHGMCGSPISEPIFFSIQQVFTSRPFLNGCATLLLTSSCFKIAWELIYTGTYKWS